MAISEAYAGSITVSTTELSLVSGTSTLQNETTDGIYQVMLDFNAMANGDSFEFRLYEKVQSSSTKRTAFLYTFRDARGADGAIWVTDAFTLLHGWDFTLKKLSGTDRAIEYSIRKVA